MAVAPGPNNVTSSVPGSPVVAINPGQFGAFITNPLTAADQGLAAAEQLFVNEVGPASLGANGTTIALAPGESFTPSLKNSPVAVTVCAASPLHAFAVVSWI